MKANSKLENLAVVAFFAAVFVPVRLLFFEYVSDYWLGSLGLLTAMLVLILWLSRAGKLGALGRMIIRRLERFRTSRYHGLVLGTNAALCAFFAFMAVSVALGADHAESKMAEMAGAAGPEPGTEAGAVLAVLALPLTDYEAFAAIAYTVDELSGNWLQHVMLVSMVECVEAVAVLAYIKRKGIAK